MLQLVIATVLLIGGAESDRDQSTDVAPSLKSVSAQPISPEDQLWKEIRALQDETLTSLQQGDWFEAAIRHRQVLLEQLRLYLTLYPGGVHHLKAVKLELNVLHELGGLQGGALEPLCRRVEQYLAEFQADDPVVWEAAYWAILCRRLDRRSPTTRPISASVLTPDLELLEAYRQYLVNYPSSQHVPHMAVRLFEQARQNGDGAEMRRLVEIVEKHFPDHAVSASLAAQWKRRQAVGKPFYLLGRQLAGEELDTRTFVGQPVLIVVWCASDPQAYTRVQEVERFRQTHPDVHVVGVNLDESRKQMKAACAKLGLTWPQINDGLGWANHFVREWGVRGVPHIFVIDRHGRLIGSRTDDTWIDLATAALNPGF